MVIKGVPSLKTIMLARIISVRMKDALCMDACERRGDEDGALEWLIGGQCYARGILPKTRRFQKADTADGLSPNESAS
jgi:hypothetical protein